jgi:hypothetical protein
MVAPNLTAPGSKTVPQQTSFAKSSVGIAKSSVGIAKSSVGYAKSFVGNTNKVMDGRNVHFCRF